MTEAETADALLGLWDTGGQIDAVDLPDLSAAYRVTAHLRSRREARGERVVGRKIGFSNRSIWARYNVDGPIWGYVWDTTYSKAPEGTAELDVRRWPEPRIEPEIAFRIKETPTAEMDLTELATCIDGISAAFEVVQSVYPGWRFTAAASVAAFALHGSLVTGTWLDFDASWQERLNALDVALSKDGETIERGHSSNVLGSPLACLQHLVRTLADGGAPPLSKGEVVTTGTMTDAWPIAAGETWSMRFDDDALPGLTLRVT